MRLTYFGHSCFLVEVLPADLSAKASATAEVLPALHSFSAEGAKAGPPSPKPFRLLLDPFFTDNPLAPCRASDIQCDYVLCTHGHDDHICDALEISQRNHATIIANFEIAEFFA